MPKDWHATKPALKAIRDLVDSRLDGNWTMDVLSRDFLLKLKREPEAEVISVSGNEKPQLDDDGLEWEVVIDKESDNGPW